MSHVTLNFSITLNSDEFVRVGDDIYTTRSSIAREQPSVHFIEKSGVVFLKKYESLLSPEMVNEWLLISAALDQVCSYETSWNDDKIMEELIAGREHPVSWYFENCQK
jgi:hypothetical protein